MNMFGVRTQQSYYFLLLVVLGLLSCSVESMRFDLPHGKAARCFSEEVMKNSMIFCNYSIVNPNKDQPLPADHTMAVEVTRNGNKESPHLAQRVQSGQFAINAYRSDLYVICFVDTTEDSQVTLSVDFEWRTGVKTISYPTVAKKSYIDKMALEVQILHDTALSIKEETTYLIQRDVEMLEINWITDTRMCHLIFVSFLICFSVAGLQLWHLKNFFEKKKII